MQSCHNHIYTIPNVKLSNKSISRIYSVWLIVPFQDNFIRVALIFFQLKSETGQCNWDTVKIQLLYMLKYIHKHVFRPSQDSSVLLGLTSREQLMYKAPGAELFQNACGVVNEQKIFCSHQSSPECSINKFRAYISTDTNVKKLNVQTFCHTKTSNGIFQNSPTHQNVKMFYMIIY